MIQVQWAHLGSNQGPLACEASALPLSYAPGRNRGAWKECLALLPPGPDAVHTLPPPRPADGTSGIPRHRQAIRGPAAARDRELRVNVRTLSNHRLAAVLHLQDSAKVWKPCASDGTLR